MSDKAIAQQAAAQIPNQAKRVSITPTLEKVIFGFTR
jgi:hypothetical protein